MVKNKIFIIFVLLICMVGLTSSARELQDAQENSDALTTGWYWPPFPWWRLPPWWWQQTQPPPPPPPPPPHHHQQPPTPPPQRHHHHSPPHHHHGPRHPPRHHQPPPSPPPPSHRNPPPSPPPSRQNPPPPPPPTHRNPPRPPRHSPSRPPPPPPSTPSAPADQNQQPPKGNDPADCSKALITVDGCISDLITSFFRDNVSVGGNCCKTISGISDDCFTKAFTQFKAPDFVGKVRVFCAQNH